uniref:Uncharacterized protein n=1 Tax=Strongyloides venezuelensis TaxID=75913 RepID=A0A0K0FDF2_STRVS
MLPTVLIFETTGSVKDLMVTDSILYAGVALLMHDNITANLIYESQILIIFFKRRFEKLSHFSSTIKSHLITHLTKDKILII